jgi:hypothetical protein
MSGKLQYGKVRAVQRLQATYRAENDEEALCRPTPKTRPTSAVKHAIADEAYADFVRNGGIVKRFRSWAWAPRG